MIRFRNQPPWLQSQAGVKPRARGRMLPGHQRGKKNSTEQAYANELDRMKLAGEIIAYWFESCTLTIAEPPNAAIVRWTADFLVLDEFGFLTFVDVKGTRTDEQAQRVKIKMAAERYPQFRFVVARQRPARAGGGFILEVI